MILTSSEVAPALGKDDLGIEQQSQDASSIAGCKVGDLRKARRRLETKYAACLATGGSKGFPLSVDRILDPKLRALAGAGMTFKNWSIKDLAECTDDLADTAVAVIETALLHPEWTAADFREFARIEEAEWERGML